MDALTPSPSKRADVERIDREPVTSSHLLSIGYEPRWQTLAVEFKDGTIYHYADVPYDRWVEFAEAASLGSAYALIIKPHFQSERMTGECPQCGDKPGIIGEPCNDCGCDVYEPPCGAAHPVASFRVQCARPRRHRDETHEWKKGRQVYGWAVEA